MIRRVFAQGCCTTPAAMCFWATAFMLLYGVGLLVGSVWPDLRQYTDTYLLTSLGLACFANFGRHRTLHCGITGPVLLIAAIAMGFIEARAWEVRGAVVWGVVLVSVAIAMLLEWRVAGHPSDSDRCSDA